MQISRHNWINRISQKNVEYLGHIAALNGIKPNQTKLTLQSSLYRKLVEKLNRFRIIRILLKTTKPTKPLTQWLKKD